jgi:hypothetical protein
MNDTLSLSIQMVADVQNSTYDYTILSIVQLNKSNVFATALDENVNIIYKTGDISTFTSSDLLRVAVMRYGPDHYGMLVQVIES